MVGGGQGGIKHVFEVVLLIPIQMSESTWTGEEEGEGRLKGERLSEGKTGNSATGGNSSGHM